MPSPASTVGPLPIPATAGGANAAFVDKTAADLLAFIASWLQYALKPKTDTMSTPPTSDGPVANKYAFAPSDVYLKRKLPALFVYWNGRSKFEEWTTVRYMRTREFNVLYVFERVKNPDNVLLWNGLISTVDATLCRAFAKRSKFDFGINGFAPGTDVRFMCNWLGLDYVGGTPGFLQELATDSIRQLSTAPGRASANKAQGGIQAGYPSFNGIVRIQEEVTDDTLEDPEDVMPDLAVAISGSEGYDESVPLLDRVLVASDGQAEAQDP
jgi:hypothetical protein